MYNTYSNSFFYLYKTQKTTQKLPVLVWYNGFFLACVDPLRCVGNSRDGR